MALALHDHQLQENSLLQSVRSDLEAFRGKLAEGYLIRTRVETAATLVEIEDLSRLVDGLQVLAAHTIVAHDIAALGEAEPQSADPEQDWNGASSAPARTKRPLPIHRDTAEYLRAKIGISRSEANRRLRLAANLLPDTSGPGAATQPTLPMLAAASSAGSVSGRATTVICDAVQRVRPVASSHQLDAMERHLIRHAIESDEDTLRVLAKRWESTLDQDGQEPTEKVLKAQQGVFLRGRRNGLHFLEIGATDEQFEYLSTVMNTATNPRCGSGATQHNDDGTRERSGTSASSVGGEGGNGTGFSLSSNNGASTSGESGNVSGQGIADAFDTDQLTRPQSLLVGLVSACRLALASDELPATGGHRAQVMVTISYQDLKADIGNAGHAVFAHQMSARSIRKLACDADIIPMVLGGDGQLLDIGRAKRLFPPYMRRGLVARDKGCAFPDCTIPATWCEAHHIVPWATGGTTSLSDGVLVCSRHHHVIHEGEWTVESINGIPWFTPPRYLDPSRTARRNPYWQVEQLVQQQLHDPPT